MIHTTSTRINRLVAQVCDGMIDAKILALHNGSAASKGTLCRQNFNQECEDATNAHLVKELYGSMTYLTMSAYFDRADVALPGFAKWAHENSNEEKGHAEKLIEYLNKRGGHYIPREVPAPTCSEWSCGLDALEYARTMEVDLNNSLLALHSTAEKDPAFQDFLESEYLPGQVNAINEISTLMRKLMRAGPGRGEYEIDRELQGLQAA